MIAEAAVAPPGCGCGEAGKGLGWGQLKGQLMLISHRRERSLRPHVLTLAGGTTNSGFWSLEVRREV